MIAELLVKTKQWSSDVKVVGTALLLLWAGTVLALDSRYLTLAGYDAGTVKQLQREISILNYNLLYAKQEIDKKQILGTILIKKQQIKEVGK